MDEYLQVTAGDVFNHSPHLFMGDTGSYFIDGNNNWETGDLSFLSHL